MDTYEKKYNEALEMARNLYAGVHSHNKAMLEQIFPELRESEDERIRKWLIDDIKRRSIGWTHSEFTREQILAYLEKQKEPEDIIGKAMSYFGAESLLDNANGLSDFEKFTAWLYCEFLRGLPKKLNQEYIKEQTKVILDAAQKELCKMPNSTELIEMWHKAKAILKEKDFRGDEWRLAQNAFMDGFARGTCVKFEKQKEQPTDAKTELVIKAARRVLNNWLDGTDCPDVSGDFAELEYAIREYDGEEKQKEQKQDEAEQFFDSAESYAQGFKAGQKKMKEDIEKGFGIGEHSFEYLAGRYAGYDAGKQDALKEQKPAEWSEEDEKILDSLIRLYSKEYSSYAWPWANGAFTYGDVVNFLKSLRPCWKPSEEQMQILRTVIDFAMGKQSVFYTCHQPLLESLYNDLKKLMED